MGSKIFMDLFQTFPKFLIDNFSTIGFVRILGIFAAENCRKLPKMGNWELFPGYYFPLQNPYFRKVKIPYRNVFSKSIKNNILQKIRFFTEIFDQNMNFDLTFHYRRKIRIYENVGFWHKIPIF